MSGMNSEEYMVLNTMLQTVGCNAHELLKKTPGCEKAVYLFCCKSTMIRELVTVIRGIDESTINGQLLYSVCRELLKLMYLEDGSENIAIIKPLLLLLTEKNEMVNKVSTKNCWICSLYKRELAEGSPLVVTKSKTEVKHFADSVNVGFVTVQHGSELPDLPMTIYKPVKEQKHQYGFLSDSKLITADYVRI
uniref:p5 protein n=1 Tax=Tenuivirus oryzabrevis TaxID=3052762 RepID=N0E6P5_9VIRU|nr:P5 protein [Tenuivirus oryzabrevis]